MMVIYLNINIDPIGLSPLDEGGPQPVFNVRILNVAYNIAPPVYSLHVTHIYHIISFEDFLQKVIAEFFCLCMYRTFINGF